jgi:hypothetical protein
MFTVMGHLYPSIEVSFRSLLVWAASVEIGRKRTALAVVDVAAITGIGGSLHQYCISMNRGESSLIHVCYNHLSRILNLRPSFTTPKLGRRPSSAM